MPSNSRSYSDIQSDMARHDEEGSGARVDEFDDDDTAGSGSGSGKCKLYLMNYLIRSLTISLQIIL